jgi:hypothetical protein
VGSPGRQRTGSSHRTSCSEYLRLHTTQINKINKININGCEKGDFLKSMYIHFTTGLRNICTMNQERGKKLQTCLKLNNNFAEEFSFYLKVEFCAWKI